ncbi:MAG: hypothetical protein MMC23_000439 [Stictis urceolatum]|nr:hypothetical protein [Stictis urceolata]
MPTLAAVTTFNALPRPSTIKATHPPKPSSPNTWHFSIHTLDISPPGDLLFLIQPSTGYIHIEGPFPISNLPSPAAQASTIAPLLLKAFNAGLGGYAWVEVRAGEGRQEVVRFAPENWVTSDKRLAEALGKEMKKLGVRKECRVVGTGEAGEEKRVEEEWGRFRQGLDCVTRG